ncbi:hypothetical protein ACFWY9_25385 [Amycolatopsis sp. NPDC059027]|uniref:hypothetical protein n=1 Tax=Amycolatopsis sp. NPDC059027 TaxID=3346709 RepID=UPI00367202FA
MVFRLFRSVAAVFAAAEAAGVLATDPESWARYDALAVRAAFEVTGERPAERDPEPADGKP